MMKQCMPRFCAFLVFVPFLLLVQVSEAAERQLGHHEDLMASVPENLSCRKRVTVTVRAPDEAAFQGDRLALQQLLGVVRIALADCPTLEKIEIVGKAGGRTVYGGVAEMGHNWLLEDIWESPSSTLAEAPSSIRDIQRALAQAGYDPGPADGHMGAKTRQAISLFQKDTGLAVDGEPNPALLTALESVPAPVSPGGGDSGAQEVPEYRRDSQDSFAGRWSGYFQCKWGTTLFDLDITRAPHGSYAGLLTYREDPEHSRRGAPEGGQIRFLGQASSDSEGIDFQRQEQTRSEGIYRWGLENFQVQHDEETRTLTGLVTDEGGCPFLQAQRPGAVVAQANLLGRWEGRTTCTVQRGTAELDTELVVKQGPALRYEATLILVPPDALAQGVEKGLYVGEARPDHKLAFVSGKKVKQSRSGLRFVDGFEIASTDKPDTMSFQFVDKTCVPTDLQRHDPASPRYRVTQPVGKGAFSEARIPRLQCQAVIDWVAQFSKEYPGVDRRRTMMGQLWPKIVILFGDNHFVPVFGNAYDNMSSDERRAIAKKLKSQCPLDPFTGNDFKNAFSLPVDNGFIASPDDSGGEFGYEAIVHEVRNFRELRNDVAARLSATLPATEESREEIRRTISSLEEPGGRFSGLPTTEVRRYIDLLKAKDAGIADQLSKDSYARVEAELTRVIAMGDGPDKLSELKALGSEKSAGILLPEDRKMLLSRVVAEQRLVADKLLAASVASIESVSTGEEALAEIDSQARALAPTMALLLPEVAKEYQDRISEKRSVMLKTLLGKELALLDTYRAGKAGLKDSATWPDRVARLTQENSPEYQSAMEQFRNTREKLLLDSLPEFTAELETTSVQGEPTAERIMEEYLSWEGDLNLPASLMYQMAPDSAAMQFETSAEGSNTTSAGPTGKAAEGYVSNTNLPSHVPLAPVISGDWRNEGEDWIKWSEDLLRERLGGSPNIVSVRTKRIPFYYPTTNKNAFLVEAIEPDDAGRYYLVRGEGESTAVLLDGSGPSVHQSNRLFNLMINSTNDVTDYLAFFVSAISAEEGTFFIANGTDDAKSLAIAGNPAEGWKVTAPIIYGKMLFKNEFLVQVSGEVEMLGNEPIRRITNISPVVVSGGRRYHQPSSSDWLNQLKEFTAEEAHRLDKEIVDAESEVRSLETKLTRAEEIRRKEDDLFAAGDPRGELKNVCDQYHEIGLGGEQIRCLQRALKRLKALQ
jgi:hypothetical protein